jgi:eukaryotic-like serine/threonine-protein kinase
LYAFGPYRLDVGGRILAREGQVVPLPPKTFELLLLMAQSPGRAFSKQELMSALWPDAFVEEANLSFQVSMLRKALGEGGGPWIETVPKHGYRFTADVKKIPAAAAAAIPAMTTATPVTTAATAITRTPWRQQLGLRLVWLVVGALAVGAGLWALRTSRPLAERPVVRLAIPLPPPETVDDWPAVAISPDGRQLAYVASRAGRSQIYLRMVDRLEAKPIPGTEGGHLPFFSPDGLWLGFFVESDNKRKKVLLSGGAPLTLSDGALGRGASWSSDGTIVFAPNLSSGLDRLSAEGGTPEVLTTLDASRHESSHRFPEVLPGGQAVLFTVKTDETQSWDDARIEAFSLRTRERSLLITGGTNARYAGGHLIYERAGALWAAPFDPVRLEVAGPSVLVLEGVSSSATYGSADFAVSRDGSLVYVPGKVRGTDRRLVRVNRAGKAWPLMDSPRAFSSLSLSPDGRRLALTIEAANDQIWVYDLERSTLSPQTLRWNNNYAIWTPDGSRLTFSSTRGKPSNLFWQPADGSGPAERLTTSANWQFAQAWSPDGKTLVFLEGGDVWILQLDGDRKPRPFLHGPFNESQARLSPNGRWLAYVSDESGREQVYVTPFPGSGGRWPISTDGGSDPVWARNGRELFYRNGDRMMAVTVTSDATFSATKPKLLFEAKALPDPWRTYDVTPEGEFLMIEPGESDTPPAQINVVLNWLQEIRPRVTAR